MKMPHDPAGVTVGTWTTPQSLIADLSQVAWEDWFARHWVDDHNHDWQWIIDHSVRSNTFRAFHHMPERPSVVFRAWAYKAIDNGALDRVCSIKSRNEYDQWFQELGEGLRRFWVRRMGTERPMRFGQSMKLTGLVMKGVCCSPSLPRAVFDRLVWFVHVPLDAFAISAVRCYGPGSGFTQRLGSIPRSAAMGYVKTLQTYEAFQDCIRHAAKKAGVPPIAFDILAWDDAHER